MAINQRWTSVCPDLGSVSSYMYDCERQEYRIDKSLPEVAKTCIVMMLCLFLLTFQIRGTLGMELIGPTRVVNITNDLSPGVGLTIHCKSADDDLGQHDLPFQSSFTWSFKSIPYTTLFYCYMSWGGKPTASFDVYKATRDDKRCAKYCLWRVTKIAVYSYDEVLGRWDLVYLWPK